MSENGTERPVEWPDMYPDPDLDCNHQYLWDEIDGLYRCMYCELTNESPPEQYVDTGTERGRDE